MNHLEDKDWLTQQYSVEDRSCDDIAKELGTYRQKVRRALIRLGVPIKDRKEAQTSALKHGRAQHPTEGRKRSDSVKLSISEGVALKWASIDEEELQKRSDRAKKQWNDMTDEQREKLSKSSSKAVLKAAKEGSQLEKFIYSGLTNAGFNVEYHKTRVFSNEKLEVDMFLPSLLTAIEIDGPSHFTPIWGQEKLQKTMAADNKKGGLLLGFGMVVLRVKCTHKTLSESVKRNALNKISDVLNEISREFPSLDKRLITIEV